MRVVVFVSLYSRHLQASFVVDLLKKNTSIQLHQKHSLSNRSACSRFKCKQQQKLHLNNVATFNVYKLVRIIIIASHNGGERPDELTLSLRRATTTTSILVPFFEKFDCENVRHTKSRSASDPRTLASVWLRVIPILHKATAYFPILFNYKRIYCAEGKQTADYFSSRNRIDDVLCRWKLNSPSRLARWWIANSLLSPTELRWEHFTRAKRKTLSS